MSRVNVRLDALESSLVTLTAKNEEKTVRAFVNEWLSVAAKLSNEGWTPSRIEALSNSFTLMKKMEAVTLPSRLVDELIAREYESNSDGLLKMFREMGTEIANIVKIDSPSIQELGKLANDFVSLLPLRMFRLTTDQKGNNIEIKIVGAGRRIESTECAFAMLDAFLNTYGFVVTDRRVNVGTIRVLASRYHADVLTNRE